MLNLNRKGCLAAFNRDLSGYDLDMFYLYVDSVSLDTNACAQSTTKRIYRAINQTSWGALSVYYKGKSRSSFQKWCARKSSNYQLRNTYGIDHYIQLWTICPRNYHYSDMRFIFGKSQFYIKHFKICISVCLR